jgi:serine/threonine protein kinase
MTESPPPDDRLLEAASAIARGEPVDWAQLPVGTDTETTTVVAQLRALEGLSQQSEPAPNTWGPFTILGEIGHGSFGTVYRAIDPNLNIEIALKVVRPRQPLTDDDFTRALSEARILAQINHPHVVRVFQVQRIDQEVGLSMELVKGRALNSIIKTDGPLSANEAMLLGIDLCGALAAVHGAQLLHGD